MKVAPYQGRGLKLEPETAWERAFLERFCGKENFPEHSLIVMNKTRCYGSFMSTIVGWEKCDGSVRR